VTLNTYDTPPPRTVVGVRFQRAGRMYFFDPGEVTDFAVNEWVVVRTEAGLDAGRVQLLPTDSPILLVDPVLGTVVRKATASDQFEMNRWKRREDEAARIAAETAVERGLVTMKIAGADYSFDGSRVTIFFTAPERVDFRELVRELAQRLGARVELRQIGARDETKVMGGVGTCGRTLCCTSWLDKFSNISIRMAKEQDLPLNLSKLTGVCGRLKCCLIYELETYQEVKGKLPKIGDVFHLPSCTAGACGTSGCAKVAGTNVPKEAVLVEIAEGGRMQLSAANLNVAFDAVPAHTKGVLSLAGRDDDAGPQARSGDGERRRRRRRRGPRDGGASADDAGASPSA
jgi:cell fate regulator YaaT (PSP1 superfamily)